MNPTLKKRFYRRTEYLPIGSSEHELLIRRIHDYSSLFAKLIAHCAVEVFNETKIVFTFETYSIYFIYCCRHRKEIENILRDITQIRMSLWIRHKIKRVAQKRYCH